MKLRVTPAALDDLVEIKQYISETLFNPSAAKSTVQRIMDDYLRLQDTPYIGTNLSSKLNVETSFRFLVSGNYLIFYDINDKTIEIHRILYGKSDYAQVLFNKRFYEIYGFSDDSSD